MTELVNLQIEQNPGLTGDIPEFLSTLENLNYLNLNNCNFTGMPAPLTKLPKTQFTVHYNKIPYGDLLPMKDLARTAAGSNAWSYEFLPQWPSLVLDTNSIKQAGNTKVLLDLDTLLPNHGGVSFQWFRNGSAITEATQASYTFTLTNETAGTYHCAITTDADILNIAVCPTSKWEGGRNIVAPEAARTNTTENITVAIGTTTAADATELDYRIIQRNGFVRISNLASGSTVHIINPLGIVLGSYTGQQMQAGIQLPTNAMYILRIEHAGRQQVAKIKL